MVPGAAASTSPGDLREAHVPGPQPRSDALWGRVRRWASKRAPQRDAIRLRGEPTTPCHSLVTPGAQDALLRVQVQGTPSPKALVSLSSIPRQNQLIGDQAMCLTFYCGFPCDSDGKESACNTEDPGLIPGLGRAPGEGNRYPLQYSGLENSMDCIVHRVAKRRT